MNNQSNTVTPNRASLDRSEIYSAAEFLNQNSIKKNEPKIHSIRPPAPPKNDEFPPPPPERTVSTKNPEIFKNASKNSDKSEGPPPTFPAVPSVPAPSLNYPGLVIKHSTKKPSSATKKLDHLNGDKSEFENLFKKINKNNSEKSSDTSETFSKESSQPFANRNTSIKPQKKPPSPPCKNKKPKFVPSESENSGSIPVKDRMKIFGTSTNSSPAVSRGASPMRQPVVSFLKKSNEIRIVQKNSPTFSEKQDSKNEVISESE